LWSFEMPLPFKEIPVGLTMYQAIDKAIEAGGSNLTAKAIVGTGSSATALLDEMCSAGHFEKTGGKTPKYSLTEKGRLAWEQDAPEDRRQQVRQGEQERERVALLGFLTLVAKKQGKALTKTELPRFPAPVRQQACDGGLIEPGPKPNTYLLLPAGEVMLQAEQPIEDQLTRLRQLAQQTVGQWRAAQKRLGQELEGHPSQPLQAAADGLAERGTEAFRVFDSALTELASFSALLSAGRQLRAEVEASCRLARETVEAEKARLEGLEARLRQQAEQQHKHAEALEQRLEERFRDLARRLDVREAAAEGPRQHDSPALPPEGAVLEATQAAYQRLRQESLRLGGIVKVPELTDAVRKHIPSLSPAAFHDLLSKWQQEDRLTLQLCNDPRLEPRAAEGIHSSRGLLFYIQMR
jgi:hypothetical protein